MSSGTIKDLSRHRHSEKTRILPRSDFFLVLGIATSPINTVGFWKVGLGELFLFIWLLAVCIRGEIRLRSNIHLWFWLCMLLSITIGAILGTQLSPEDGTPIDVITWITLALIHLSILSVGYSRSAAQISKILLATATVMTLIYGSMYYLWLSGVNGIGPIPFDYAGVRFTGGADNPHLFALPAAVALFTHIAAFIVTKKKTARLYRLAMAYVMLQCALATESATFIASGVLSGLVALIVISIKRVQSRANRLALMGVYTWVITVLIFLFHSNISEAIANFIAADPNGQGRLDKWARFSRILELSPIFGVGPGSHSGDGQEFHNSYLDIFAFGGLVAIIAFVMYLFRAVRLGSNQGTVLLLIMPLLTYGVAGFAARRLVFWTVLPLVLAGIENVRRSRQDGSSPTDERPDLFHFASKKVSARSSEESDSPRTGESDTRHMRQVRAG